MMITIAKGMTDEELKAAAEYFGAMKWTPWIKVVEAEHGPEDAHAGRHVPQARGTRQSRLATASSRRRTTSSIPRLSAIRVRDSLRTSP